MPNPECTYVPYLRKSRYHSNDSGFNPKSMIFCSKTWRSSSRCGCSVDLPYPGAKKITTKNTIFILRMILHIKSFSFRGIHYKNGHIIVLSKYNQLVLSTMFFSSTILLPFRMCKVIDSLIIGNPFKRL